MFRYFSELAITFLVLVLTLWCTMLRPSFQVNIRSGQTTVEMRIENMKQAFQYASYYTVIGLTALRVPPRTYVVGVLSDNYPWIFVVVYLLHHLYCYCHIIESLMTLLTVPAQLHSAQLSFDEAHTKMLLLFVLQLFSGMVLNFMLCYTLDRPRSRPVRHRRFDWEGRRGDGDAREQGFIN